MNKTLLIVSAISITLLGCNKAKESPNDRTRQEFEKQENNDADKGFNNLPPVKKEVSYSAASTNRDDLSDKIREALQTNPALSGGAQNVQFTVDESNRVTLTGAVSNYSEKSKVESLVRQVRGVKTVNNKLYVSK